MDGIFIPLHIVTLIAGLLAGWLTFGLAIWVLYKVSKKRGLS